jgi:hypothetical protein
VIVQFEEIADLHNIVERGPDWNEIEQIMITLNRTSDSELESAGRIPAERCGPELVHDDNIGVDRCRTRP